MDKSVEHIIGEYVRGKISAEDRVWLEQAMQTNAQLAAEVNHLQTSYTIERYISGKMEDSERAAFEKQMSIDTDLQEKVKAEEATQQFLQTARRLRLRQDLEKVAQKSQERKVQQQRLHRRFLFAILFMAVALVTWRIIPSTKDEHESNQQDQPSIGDTTSLQQIAQDTIVAHDTLGRDTQSTIQKVPKRNTTRNTTASRNDSLAIAMLDDYDKEKFDLPAKRGDAIVNDWQINYQNGEYEQVINNLSPLIDNELSKNDTARLALGLACYYHTVFDYNKALAQFDFLIKKNSIFIGEARWFKAAAMVRQGKTKEAIPILLTITQEDGAAFNKGKASELLAKLPQD